MIKVNDGKVTINGSRNMVRLEFMALCKGLLEAKAFKNEAEMVDHVFFATASEDEQAEILKDMIDDAIKSLEGLLDD